MTSELQQNRYDRLIRRVGGIIGTGSKVSEVLTELFPMIDVETNKGELQHLSGVRLGMGAAGLTGDAAENAKVQLFNPAGSGALLTVTDVYVTSSTAQRIFVGRTTIVFAAGVGTQLARDSRVPVGERPVGQMFTDSSAAFVDANIQFRIRGSETFNISVNNDVMVLAPGTGISVGASTSQTELIVTFFWRERVAETSELNF